MRRKRLIAIFSKTGGVVLVLVVLSLLFWGGLLLYQNNLNKELNIIEQEITDLDQTINQIADIEKQNTIISVDKNLNILKDLFVSHVYWSELFTKIENLTGPQVYFSQTKIDISEDEVSKEEKIKINFSGNTLTYTSLAKQMKAFQEESLIEKVEVSGISISSEKGIDFTLLVIFSKDILLKTYD